jgi:apolipoprotein N-acyltransferase
MTTKNRIFLSILSGLLLSVAFPPFPIFITAFFGFIPLLLVINSDDNENSQKKNRIIRNHSGFRYIYITFFIYHLCSNWWISSLQENTDPYLFLSGIALDLLHPIFFFFPFLLFFITRRIIGKSFAMWLFPLFWTIFEWLHSIGDMGYSWLSIAHTQFTNIYWYQIMDIAGIYGATFLISLVNILIYKLMLDGKNENGKYSFRYMFNSLQKKFFSIIIYVAIIIPMVYGYVLIQNYDYDTDLSENDFINIGLIQPNIDPWDKWGDSKFKQIQTHLRLQDSLINTDGRMNLCIWSETAIPMLDMSVNRDMQMNFITDNLISNKTSLLTGIARLEFFDKNEQIPITSKFFGNDSSQKYCSYNSAILINYDKDTTSKFQFHDKGKLTPFAEGFPYVEYLSFAKDWLQWGVGISSWTKGSSTNCLLVKNDGRTAKIAPIICIESVYPDYVRQFVANGANIIAVITNDAWYNYSYGPEQHYVIAATRAIENRRYLARCANSGVTGFISPTGQTIYRAEQYKETSISASIPILNSDEKTIYTKYGDYLPILFCLLSLISIIIRLLLKNKLMK